MLPFLKPKRQDAGMVTVYRARDEEGPKPAENAGLEAAADDLLRAIHSNDKKLLCAALTAAFEIIDSAPHEEGPQIETE